MRFIKALFIFLMGSFITPVSSQENLVDEISLDGTWEIIFDQENSGREASLYMTDSFSTAPAIRTIEIPSSWEKIEKDYEGVVYYRKSFWVPEDWKDRNVRMHFGAVNYRAEVWINDNVVGYHEGGFTPFEFRINEMIRFGEENILTMRVMGPLILSDKVIDGVAKLEVPSWRGGITGGIWQSVELISTGESYVRDVFIHPDIQTNTARLEMEMDHTAVMGSAVSVIIQIREDKSGEEVSAIQKELNLKPGRNRLEETVAIPGACYWSPDHPFLYRAEVKIISDGAVLDSRSERFGMRELTVRNSDFYLNNKPVYIKAVFFEGLYPNGIAYPDSKEMARREIQLAKDAGFNMIRPWRHPPAPMWLDLADEMGVMVVGSPVLECMSLPLSTPYLPWRVENEIRQSVLRDRNHASIVQWELFNELHRPVLKQMMRPMALLARELDPTRLILDESGGWAYGANLYLPGETEPSKFNDIHTYPGPFLSKDQFDGFLSIGLTDEEKEKNNLHGQTPGRNVVPGLMSFISELGYGSLPNLKENNLVFADRGNPLTPAYRYHKRLAEEQEKMLRDAGVKSLYPDMEQFYLDEQKIHGEANRRMIEAARSNPGVDGYCIHALVAGDWILGAGLLDLWRNPKTHAYNATKAANQPRILVIRALPRNVYARDGLKISVTGVNDSVASKGTLEIVLLSPVGEKIFGKEIVGEFPVGVVSLSNLTIASDDLKGEYSIRATFYDEELRVLASNAISCFVLQEDDLELDGASVSVLEKDEKMRSFLLSKGAEVLDFKKTLKKSVPVLVSGTGAKNNWSDELMEELVNFAGKGGTVIFTDGLVQSFLDRGILPFTATVQRAKGLWTCIPHIPLSHPLMCGLPTNKMMDDLYENVWAFNTLINIRGEETGTVESVVASIGYDWFSSNHKMHYSGPGSSWWGSDLAVVPYGKGRFIISQLRISDSLANDPVADQLLINFVKFSSDL